jgi:rhodanese-related sulfurtransferase
MHKLILIALLAAAPVFSQSNGTPKQSPSQAKKLSKEELDHFLAHPEGVLFIDVRRPDEVSANGGFPVYLSIQAGELEKHLSEIPKDRLIITVSNHAARASRAADLLESKGFKVAGAAGVEDYASDGGQIAKVAVPPANGARKQ